ncbi:hypothetical protein G8764_11780 [Pseudomaricurvus alcaniphilus]|nr:hypothetical protein [Pseudomaricurvus alcaniphilus]NHN37979.1 hypothetical protein [Pseudomaricurvus alcaniphilus]
MGHRSGIVEAVAYIEQGFCDALGKARVNLVSSMVTGWYWPVVEGLLKS